MGGGGSKTEQLSEIINNITTKVVIKHSASATTRVRQVNIVTISGRHVRIKNLSSLNKANVKLSLMQNDTVNAKMQTELVQKIMGTIKLKSSDFPDLGGIDESSMTNIVRTNVHINFNKESIANLQTAVDQTNRLIISGFDISIDQAKNVNDASATGALIQKMSTSIATEILSKSDVAAATEREKTFFAADFVKSVGSAVSGVINSVSDFFSLKPMTLLLLLIVVLVGGFVAYQKFKPKPNK